MKINLLTWDSNFFNKKIGEIFLNTPVQIKNTDSFDLIVIKQPREFDLEIPRFTKTFQETKIVFEKALISESSNDYSLIKDTDEEPKKAYHFFDLAYTSGRFSRFLLDKNFGEENFTKLYQEWVINSVNKKFAIKIFYIEENNQPIGFVTLQKNNGVGRIGLIATKKEHQGKGLGKKLLEYVENFCISSNINSLEIPTQEENINACKFYERQKYKIKNKEIITHFWRK